MESAREGARIRRKTVTETTLEHLHLAGLGRGMSAIDVGCASGEVLREMARIVYPARVMGFDLSGERIEQSRAIDAELGFTNIDYQQGDVTAMPFENDRFDLVWSRFLIEYLPRPTEALAELKRIARPGGKVVVADLDGNCTFNYPLDNDLAAGLDQIFDIIGHKTGFDPYVGRKLYTYFHEVGFSNIRVDALPYHLIAGAPGGEIREQWVEKILIFKENFKLIEPGRYPEFEPMFDRFLDFLDREDTLTYSVVFIVQGVK
jgi:ubiquinone/menaquinone biosynthesis C-methylase UbiE